MRDGARSRLTGVTRLDLLARLPLVAIDDMGQETGRREYTPGEICDLLEARTRAGLDTAISTNINPTGLADYFADRWQFAAERFAEFGVISECRGANLRLRRPAT